MTIEELQQIVIAFRDQRDRKQFHNPKDLADAIAIEAWELMEKFLWKSQEKSYELAKDAEVVDEYADIMSFMLLFAEAADINISEAIQQKLKKNWKKYPIEKAKGNSDKYTKL